MHTTAYAAVLATPFAMLGVVTENDAVSRIDFLPLETPQQAPLNAPAQTFARELQAYLQDAEKRFTLPQLKKGTSFQQRVWQALTRIPPGQTVSYGELAQQLGSAPRAVGQACGANPLPLIVPCHRVLAKNGVGGFMHSESGGPLRIKHWLLQHEAGARRPD